MILAISIKAEYCLARAEKSCSTSLPVTTLTIRTRSVAFCYNPGNHSPIIAHEGSVTSSEVNTLTAFLGTNKRLVSLVENFGEFLVVAFLLYSRIVEAFRGPAISNLLP